MVMDLQENSACRRTNDFFSQRCGLLGINSFKIISLNAWTDGQAMTIAKVVQTLDSAGLYYFKSVSIFRDAYRLMADVVKEKYKESYVVPLI